MPIDGSSSHALLQRHSDWPAETEGVYGLDSRPTFVCLFFLCFCFRVWWTQPNALQARENAAAAAASGQRVSQSLDFLLEVNSTNPEDAANTEDNRLAISLPIQVETDLSIKGFDPISLSLSLFVSKTQTILKTSAGEPCFVLQFQLTFMENQLGSDWSIEFVRPF